MKNKRWARALYQPVLPLGKDGKRVTACEEHIALSKEAAREGMVLLKNEQNVLPLPKGSRIALFGKASLDYVKGGGGSGDVTVAYATNLYEGLTRLGETGIYEELVEFYRRELERQYEEGAVPGMTVEPELPEELLNGARQYTDTAVISICRFSGEGWDRKCADVKKDASLAEASKLTDMSDNIFEDGDFYLTHREKAMVEAVVQRFARVIVLLNVGGVTDTEWFAHDPRIQAVLMAWQGGMEGGLAAAELITGKANPCGKLADTFAKRLEDYPSTAGFHESDDYVAYTEDIYVGYHYFETIPGAAEKVNYPFGFGLSYTDFSVRTQQVEKQGDVLKVTTEVCNIGKMAGKEVVQVYFSAPQGRLGRPARELIAFGKTRLLQPGETQTITLQFCIRDMAAYDDMGKVKRAAYLLEKGSYSFYVGTSVREAAENSYHMVLEQDMVTEQLSNRLVPHQLPKRMLADGTYEELPWQETVSVVENVLKPQSESEMTGYASYVRSRVGRRMWETDGQRHFLNNVADGKVSMGDFLEQLSDRQLAELLGGQPNLGVANTYGFGNLPEYGVPSVMTADGPAGLRIKPECGICTTAWPCATMLACTWNAELLERIGVAGGAEVKENNLSVWLTPAVNIHRSPLCGRNFEYYSEDPLLTGKLAAAMVKGIQSNRVAATVKHFALNNKETNRKDSDSRASERAIREIYLKPFEIVVKEAKVWCVMSSYNKINACRASESRELLEDILRGEWGFDGMVMTDWWNFGEHYKEVKAGNDVKMACGFPERILEAMDKHAISREELEMCARRVLELILKLE